MKHSKQTPLFIYTYACHEDERSLCSLEMRSLFGVAAPLSILSSPIEIDPSRSPFIKERIEVLYEGDSLAHIATQVRSLPLLESTFKVMFVKRNDLDALSKVEYSEQRAIEREIGLHIHGRVNVNKPDYLFGIVTLGGRWYFGHYTTNKSIWLHHMKKPHSYSIALPTRVARAIANIAVPSISGVKAIDPCCGIGTVLVEALSIGIDIVGRDINPLVTRGARENIAHFGLIGDVELGDIADVTSSYDVAIVDLPYNLVSQITPEAQLAILQHTRRIATKAVIISIEPIDGMIAGVGLTITDYCIVRKGSFSRHIMVCN